MRITRLAHISDLHVRNHPDMRPQLWDLFRLLEEACVDHIVLTGDVTDRGRPEELQLFEEVFAPWLARRRLTLVPGNHDCNGHDVSTRLMHGARVLAEPGEGLWIVRFNSTAPHNRSFWGASGEMSRRDLEDILDAFRDAPRYSLTVLALHHHLLPLPVDLFIEKFSVWLRMGATEELALGEELLQRLRGRCALVMHGHRHHAGESLFESPGQRPLGLYNAGASLKLQSVRVFTHCAGELVHDPVWLHAQEPVSTRLVPKPQLA